MKSKEIEQTEITVDDEIKSKKKVKKLKLKKPKLKKQKVMKEKVKKDKNVKEKVKKQKKSKKKYKIVISIIIIVVSFIFILLGIFVGLIGTGIINLHKDTGPIYYSLEEKLKVGHYVVYDAGNWDEDKDVPDRKNSFTLGGYTKDSSRNDGVTCNYLSDEDTSNKRSGWRVFSIEEGIVTLIHDGISMCYYHGYGNNTNDKSVNILSGNDENINFDNYLDNKYASSVRILSKEDIDKYYGEDSSYKKIEDDIISVGIPYWLASKQGTNFMWYVTEGGTIASDQVGVYGVRVLVTLGSGVKTTGLTDNKEWILAIDAKDEISEE